MSAYVRNILRLCERRSSRHSENVCVCVCMCVVCLAQRINISLHFNEVNLHDFSMHSLIGRLDKSFMGEQPIIVGQRIRRYLGKMNVNLTIGRTLVFLYQVRSQCLTAY